jgi:glycosidase
MCPSRPRSSTTAPARFRGAWRAGAALGLASACSLVQAAAAPPVDLSDVPARPRASGLDPHWHRGAFMQVFVRAYQDSDGDGIGDLRGLTSRLDHLKDLGVRGLWLMPVTASSDRDHGYATTDFRALEPHYGRFADFDELLRQAHARGIGVVMDYVINHSSAAHPLFVESREGPQNAYRSWYLWRERMPEGWDIWGKNPWYHAAIAPWTWEGHPKDLPVPPPEARDFYFGTFGPHMPDFDVQNAAVWRYHESSLRFWLNRGLDGFRLDATPHLVENGAKDWNDQPQSRALTKRLHDLVHAYPRRYVVCEATSKPPEWASGQVCGAAFAFGRERHFMAAAKGDAAAVQALAATTPEATNHRLASFLSNHDGFAGQRPWDQLGADPATREARYKAAAAAYLLGTGTPFIYYGEELGQAGATSLRADPVLRAPIAWTADPAGTHGFTRAGVEAFRPALPNALTHNAAVQRADPDSLLNFYKAMLAIRNGRASVARGEWVNAEAQGHVLRFERRLGRERTIVAINFGAEPARIALPGVPSPAALRVLHPRGAGGPGRVAGGAVQVQLPAFAVRVYAVAAGPAGPPTGKR